MAANTAIEWCDATFNPWIGCTKVSTEANGGGGCDHCYAAVSTPARAMRIKWGAGKPRHRTGVANWREPLTWNAQPFYECPDCGLRGDARTMGDESKACKHLKARSTRRRVFCASLADVFDNAVPAEWRADLFRLIFDTANLDWLLLTKRIGNAHGMIVEALVDDDLHGRGGLPEWPWPNVWLGATVVNQEEADRDIPKLLATPARVRFLSMEPLLGPVDLHGLWSKQTGRKAIAGPIPSDYYSFINWVIAGGESGPGARPMHPDWARSLRDQCAAAGVPFLFKQWGEWIPMQQAGPGPSGEVRKLADATRTLKVGKKVAGRLLDGREHNAFPEVAHA